MSNAREMRDMLNDILEECPVIGKFYGLEMETERIADHLIANGVTINRGTEDTPVAYNLSPTAARLLLQENGELIPLTSCQQWIPVSERLPESKTKILVYGGNALIWVNGVNKPMPSVYTGYMRGFDEGWFTWDEHKYIAKVTHWMPLPEPPKEGE